jgi:hypothetical protein
MVIVMVVVPVGTRAQRTVDAADDAACHAADNIANEAADRAEYAVADVAAFMCTLPRALSNTLSMRRYRRGKQGEDAAQAAA